jgi:hypothetical protein
MKNNLMFQIWAVGVLIIAAQYAILNIIGL